MIETKVWYKIVFFMSLWLLKGGRKGVLETALCFTNMLLGVGNIDVLSAEVWHEIILWMAFRILERRLHLMTQSLLSFPFVSLGVGDINVL